MGDPSRGVDHLLGEGVLIFLPKAKDRWTNGEHGKPSAPGFYVDDLRNRVWGIGALKSNRCKMPNLSKTDKE